MFGVLRPSDLEHRGAGRPGIVLAAAIFAWCAACGDEVGAQEPVTPERTLNPIPSWDWERRDVAVDGIGNAAVSQTSPGYALLLRVDVAGWESPVATLGLMPFDSGPEKRSGVALDLFGRGAVGWIGAGEGRLRRAFVRPFDEEAPGVGPSIAVDGELGNDGVEMRVAAGMDGHFALSWSRDLGSGWQSIWTRDIAADGETMSIATWVGDRQQAGEVPITSDLAKLDGGRSVVVWDSGFVDLQGLGIAARIVPVAGGPAGSPWRVNEFQSGDQFRPSVASNGRDRFVVSWEGLGSRGERRGIFARVFDGSGSALTGEIEVNDETYETPAEQAEVAMDPDGSFLVAYRADAMFSLPEKGLRLRAFLADGTPLGGAVQVDEELRAWPSDPAVAVSAAGPATVVWSSERAGVFGDFNDTSLRRFSLPCRPGPYTICLGEAGRYLIRAFWQAPDGALAFARPSPWTRESGGLAFFSPGHADLAVKVLDACALDGTHWIFAAGLTDVRSTLVVTDTWTGETRALRNSRGETFAAGRFVGELGRCAVEQPAGVASGKASSTNASLEELGPSREALLLRDGRIRISASWRTPAGAAGAARAVQTAEGDGLFWFFDPANPELVVKLLDGCSVNAHLWLFVGGLTDLEVELRVVDVATGAARIYRSEQGEAFEPIADLTALADCP